MAVLSDTEPKKVFHFFEEICGIPHGSGDTWKISNYLVSFAKERGLACRQDELGNVVIKKDGTKGYEQAPVVMLQGHMDMVCEKESGCDIDFQTQGLRLVKEGNVIHAEGTTLGGDDGIAVAFALAILDSDDILHPPLEVVITVDEEIGMLGASYLDTSDLQAEYMLNLDSEDEGQLLVGCAGGVTAVCHMPVSRMEISELFKEGIHHPICLELVVDGLQGGHSGMEIIKQRGNANKLIGRALKVISEHADIWLVDIDGGKKDNAIARYAKAMFVADKDCVSGIETCVDELQKILSKEYAVSDPAVCVSLRKASAGQKVTCMTKAAGCAIVDLLFLLPNGICRMSNDIPGLVQTSLNLGVLSIKNEAHGTEELVAGFSVRSSIGSEKDMLTGELRCLCEHLGGVYTEKGAYPAWEYKEKSKLRDIMVSTYEELYGEKPKLDVIHAGVECGLFTDKMKGLDCVSYGPQMYDIHTPKECLHIDSVRRTWEYTLAILKKLK